MPRALHDLARRRGIVTEYTAATGERQRAEPETLVALLRSLGEPIDRAGDAAHLLAGNAAAPARTLPPVIVAWDGKFPDLPATGGTDGSWVLTSEFGEQLRLLGAASRESAFVHVETPVPFGLHRLVSGAESAHVVAAPRRAGRRDSFRAPPALALFAPAYAVTDHRRRPQGDLTSLRRFGEVALTLGCSLVATLPLLAELSRGDGGSDGQHPYSPLSRLWWNEAYLDVSRIDELDPELVDEFAHSELPRERNDAPRYADLAAVADAIRPLLDAGAEAFERRRGRATESWREFSSAHPDLGRYARFRAAIEVAGADWTTWPSRWRLGSIGDGEVPAAAVRRHEYAQFALDRQLAEDRDALRARGGGFAFDLPVGCTPLGYDPWARVGTYAAGVTIGAPPDAFYEEGQDWGLAAPLPDGDRATGYSLLRACLSRSFRHARVTRIDHVMGLSRLWWVPAGMDASAGAYVRYHLEEQLAICCLEAWRNEGDLVGEDLGTVERGLRTTLRRHGVAGMRVALFDLGDDVGDALSPPRGTASFVTTHDTATFAGWFDGAEIAARVRDGRLDAVEAEAAVAQRRATVRELCAALVRAGLLEPGETDDVRAVFRALVTALGAGNADLLVVVAEDLWAERDPQNVPGTPARHSNFARLLAKSVEEIRDDASIAELFSGVARARKGRAARTETLVAK